LRSARALTDSPISASSAAACTAVPRISPPLAGTGLRDRGREGVPAGCGGWRRRVRVPVSLTACGRRRAVAPAPLTGRGLARGVDAGFFVAGGRAARFGAGVPAVAEPAAGVLAVSASGAGASGVSAGAPSAGRSLRLPLRR
jgi:hypothetical protein